MSRITIPAYICEISNEDTIILEDLMNSFGNARRRAYSMHQKGIEKNVIEKKLQNPLNARYIKDAHYFIKDLPPHVTFGGIKNQRQREKGKINNEEYKKRRNSILISRGEKSHNGNVNTRINLEDKTLRINVGLRKWIYPKIYIPEKYLVKYEHLLIGNNSYMVTIRRRDNNKGFDVKISVPIEITLEEKPRILAIDTNAGHSDFAVMNKSDNTIIAVGKINHHETQHVKTNKRDDILHKVVNKFGNIARHYNADIIVGKLNTANFKSNKGAARKIKNIPHFKFRQYLSKLEKEGIQVTTYSEAYTTVLGKKLSQKIGIDVHKSSAISFALKITNYDKFRVLLSEVRSNEGAGSQRTMQKKGSELTVPCQSNPVSNDYPVIPSNWGLSEFADSLKNKFVCLKMEV